jgi:hypothetical protein
LGVDNTEFRSLFSDRDNNLWLRSDTLYGDENVARFNFPVFGPSGIAGKFLQYSNWFNEFHKFPKNRIFNLDPDSLIDAFQKVDRIS